MRLIEATVPENALQELKTALSDSEYEFFVIDETSPQYAALLHIPIPEEKVQSVLEILYECGLTAEDHVVILKAEVDTFARAEKLDADVKDYKRVAAAELEGKTSDLIPDERTFLTMMVLSTIVAAVGLLLDSAAVVVGSMVIAPLFGPAISASVGTVIDRHELFYNGVRLQLFGIGVAIVSATVFTWTLKSVYLVPAGFPVLSAPQIAARLSPDILSLVVAFAAGIAGVLSIATGAGMALVGVMMAAALLPPAATVGIGIAWQEPVVAIQSGILLAVNVFAINFAGLVTLWYLGYRPESWIKVPQTRRALFRRGGLLLLAILLVSGILLNVTYANAQRSQLQRSLEESINDRLSEQEYENVSLVEVQTEEKQEIISRDLEKVIITIARPPDEPRPGLHHTITETVHEHVEQNVRVDIRVTLLVSSDQEKTKASNSHRSGSPAPAVLWHLNNVHLYSETSIHTCIEVLCNARGPERVVANSRSKVMRAAFLSILWRSSIQRLASEKNPTTRIPERM